MNKLFAVTFTPEELVITMAALCAAIYQMSEDSIIPFVIDSMKSALNKCEAIRPEAIKHISPEQAKLFMTLMKSEDEKEP